MSTQTDTVVRRVVPGDWPALKALRLEALQDTPLAYCERHADALAQDDDAWRYRATRGSEGGDSCQLFALVDGEPVATAVTFRGDGPADWWLAAVYVRPEHRGQGLLDALVEGLAAHARSAGGEVLRLEVHEDNPRAHAAYRRLGFTDTGARRPYPLGAGEEREMQRSLRADARLG